jgi:hypothetical protein
LSAETISLIQQMAKENFLGGAECIHGELLKLGIHVATATVQKYLRLARPPRAPNQNWSVFLKNLYWSDRFCTRVTSPNTPSG